MLAVASLLCYEWGSTNSVTTTDEIYHIVQYIVRAMDYKYISISRCFVQLCWQSFSCCVVNKALKILQQLRKTSAISFIILLKRMYYKYISIPRLENLPIIGKLTI